MRRSASLASLLVFSGFVACSGAEGDKGGTTLRPDGGTASDTSNGSETFEPDDGGFSVEDVRGNETAPSGCFGTDPTDCDADGYKGAEDCNDKDPTINPDAYDFPDDKVDNDCDGTVDNPVTTCDATPGSTDGMQFARAADLCPQRSVSKKYGGVYDPVFKVEFGKIVGGFGSSTTRMGSTKIITKFGNNMPRAGTTLFGMQSGPLLTDKPREAMAMDSLPVQNACAAMSLKDADCKSLTTGTGVPFGASVSDYQEVRMFIRVPSNAKAMLFDFAFFSSEFNEYWSSPFNDAFFAIVTSKKVAGLNVAKDDKGRALTVNSGFFQLCPKAPGPSGLDPSKSAALATCVGVDGDATKSIFGTLKGTFFDGAGIGSTDDTVMSSGKKYIYGGGSGWLTTKFAVEPGESMIVRFMVHDTSDGALDSAAIVDNIRWEKTEPKIATGEVERPPM